MRTIGVEEEYLLVGDDGVPVALAQAALEQADAHQPELHPETGEPVPGGALEAELKQQQLETSTPPCSDLEVLGKELRVGRANAGRAAGRAGAHAVAVGTSPLPFTSTITVDHRYREISRMLGITAREQLTCGCHVHVSVDSDAEGVAVIDRISPWIPVILAISSNSPFWHGQDSHYASYRSQVWSRWPSAGPTTPFGSVDAYHAAVEGLVATGTALDAGMVYFDARLSARYPTVEVRIADVCLDVDDAVLVAALSRALVETAARDAAAGRAPSDQRHDLLRAATWRAGRSGLRADLLSPTTNRPVPASAAVAELLEHVRQALVDAGDLEAVEARLARVAERGTGADQQRRWRAEGLETLVERASLRTLA